MKRFVLLLTVWAMGLAGVLTAVVLPATSAQAATTTAITSAGPLTEIGISTDLNCSVAHVDDIQPEFFGTTACGTLAVVDGVLYGPAVIPAGDSANPRTTWTEVSQTAVTGTGTAANPYKVVTVVAAGASGVTLTQTDTYVVGQESYRTDVATSVSAGRATAATVRLYRAGDCFLQNSDEGFGSIDAGSGAVACVNAIDNGAGVGVSIPGTRIEQWVPLTSGSHYFESGFDTVWAQIGSQFAFPDTCDCSLLQDNGAGLSWDFAVLPGAQKTQSHLTNFSPLGAEPLVTSKTAGTATVGSGGADSYTITIHNPGATTVPLTSFTDTLPTGFTYTTGSTTGAATTDPTINGQSLTWPVSVSLGPDQSTSLHFSVTAASTAGTYFNEASGTATADAVVATGPTAPVTVTVTTPPTTPPTPPTTPTGVPVVRIAGVDRYATAIAASTQGYPTRGTAGAVVLARGDLYPDALVGTPLAKAHNAPVLLTTGTTLPVAVKTEIQRVLPAGGTVYLLGGSDAIPAGIDVQLKNLGFTPVRYAGADRYATALAVAHALGDPSTVLLATGTNFPDALAAGPAAAHLAGAILLTNGAVMATGDLTYLVAHPGQVYAIGGPAAAARPSATALVGADRYATAASVATRFFTAPTTVGVATGTNFPDALTGSALLAGKDAPILLTTLTSLPSSTTTYLTSVKSSVKTAYIFGGTDVVSAVVATAVGTALK